MERTPGFPRVNGWGKSENPATWQEIAVGKPSKEEDEDDQRYQEVSQKEEAAEAEKERPRGPGRRPSVQEPPAMGMPPETEGHLIVCNFFLEWKCVHLLRKMCY